MAQELHALCTLLRTVLRKLQGYHLNVVHGRMRAGARPRHRAESERSLHSEANVISSYQSLAHGNPKAIRRDVLQPRRRLRKPPVAPAWSSRRQSRTDKATLRSDDPINVVQQQQNVLPEHPEHCTKNGTIASQLENRGEGQCTTRVRNTHRVLWLIRTMAAVSAALGYLSNRSE